MCLSYLIREKLKRSSNVDEEASHETSKIVSLCSTFVEIRKKKTHKHKKNLKQVGLD